MHCLKLYAAALWRHWIWLVFAVLAAFDTAVERAGQYFLGPSFLIPATLWWSLAFAAIFIAQFLAWRDIKKERDALRAYDVTQATLKRLASHRQGVVKFQHELVTDAEQLGSWWARYLEFRKQILSELSTGIGPAEATLFETWGTFEFLVMPGDPENVSYTYLQRRSMMIRDHKWIAQAVKDYGRKRTRSMREELQTASV